jgi:hypothetical protein
MMALHPRTKKEKIGGLGRPAIKWAMAALFLVGFNIGGFAAYHHKGEIDSAYFLEAYPEKAGTKLDSCAQCHTGGSYDSGGKAVALGSCQWCHYKYGYDASGNMDDTLNPYGMAYKVNGRSSIALRKIEGQDSDADGYSNKIELDALRFPGDGNDDPSKVPAPFRVFSRKLIESLPRHTQLLLMNAHKSTDFYANYTGVSMEEILQAAGALATATHINVYAPDGFSQYHPMNPDPNPLFYHVRGAYPAATYQYSEAADTAKNKDGWCDYGRVAGMNLENDSRIENKDGLKLMLAYQRDTQYLDAGKLASNNKLDGEGPFRVVPPQKKPGPPDQRSTARDQKVIWPLDPDADHNAGYSIRTATFVKVGPLPAGTTDIDLYEAGWKYVDEGKIVVYGAIHPGPTIIVKLDALIEALDSCGAKTYKNLLYKKLLVFEAYAAHKLATWGNYKAARSILQNGILEHVDGCSTNGGGIDKDDWVTDCELQKKIYWDLHELLVLFGIIV